MSTPAFQDNLITLFGGLDRPVISPYSETDVYGAMAEAPPDAVMFLDAPRADFPVDLMVAAGKASGKTFVVRHDNSTAVRKSLNKLGLHMFKVAEDASSVYATAEKLNAHPLISEIEYQVEPKSKVAKSIKLTKAHMHLFEQGEPDQQLATGVVMMPNDKDTDGEFFSAEEVATAHLVFMLWYRNFGLEHIVDITEDMTVVESWIVRVDNYEHNGLPVPRGSWMMTVKVWDSKIWAAFKNGELTGFSIGGDSDVSDVLEDIPS